MRKNLIKNLPKIGKEIATQSKKSRVPNRINPRQNNPRHILIKLTKTKHKEQILKAAKGKATNNTQGDSHKDNSYLSRETLQARREWQDILKEMKEKNLQPRLLYPAKLSFSYEGKVKSFIYKQKLREFCTIKPGPTSNLGTHIF